MVDGSVCVAWDGRGTRRLFLAGQGIDKGQEKDCCFLRGSLISLSPT